MQQKELYETMYSELSNLGMCEGGLATWNTELDQDAICKTMHKYLDFVLERDYPSCEFMENNFDKKILNDNKIYVNDDVSSHDIPNGSYIICGNSTGDIIANNYAAVTLHIRHKCKVKVRARGMSAVFVRVYDEAEVDISQEERSKVNVYKYGDKCKVNTTGNVSVKNREVY